MTIDPVRLFPVEIRLPAKVIAGLDQLAARAGLGREAMAKRLFEAAYAARFADVGDPALETAVRRQVPLRPASAAAPAVAHPPPAHPSETAGCPGEEPVAPDIAAAVFEPPPAPPVPQEGAHVSTAAPVVQVETVAGIPDGATVVVSGVKFPPALTTAQQKSIKALYAMGGRAFDIAQQLKIPVVQVREFLAASKRRA